ncbi:MAG: arsenosugar biosynthesis radical SAM (seleno)protein ArsS [bacterium]|nr:arsenosugar biosynthesis radical SAM (seleno)protein ArsS [bacterium]
MNPEPKFSRMSVSTLQINVGKICNMSCSHCHVEAGPHRTETMDEKVYNRVIELMDKLKPQTIDITGGAPELNPAFRPLVKAASKRGCKIIDRCNLSVLLIKSQHDLIDFLVDHKVHIIASLPCYSKENVDKQRGNGAFDKSIRAIKSLNNVGYGIASDLVLDFIYNPAGIHLAPQQHQLENDYKIRLKNDFGIQFNNLYALHNFPVGRFAEELKKTGQWNHYMNLLVQNYNPSTIDGLMCRSQLSIGYDGRIFDCDFHQMENIYINSNDHKPMTIFELESLEQVKSTIPWRSHCYACTAGNGASCSGSIT